MVSDDLQEQFDGVRDDARNIGAALFLSGRDVTMDNIARINRYDGYVDALRDDGVTADTAADRCAAYMARDGNETADHLETVTDRDRLEAERQLLHDDAVDLSNPDVLDRAYQTVLDETY